jgi:hypothetical protein
MGDEINWYFHAVEYNVWVESKDINIVDIETMFLFIFKCKGGEFEIWKV